MNWGTGKSASLVEQGAFEWTVASGCGCAVLAQAYAEQRVLITLDSDDGWLAVAERLPHVGIVRLLEDLPERQATLCRHVLERYAAELAQGALVTANMDKVRIRPGG